ncbi:MAG: hypothetical protein ACHQLA_04815 [Ignavibacteriales bacterium]
MRLNLFLIITALLTYTACSTLTLESANFAWPIESVLPVDKNGNVFDEKYSVEFNSKPLFLEEHQDSNAYMGEEIRLIRDHQGYYYITAREFKNVYVFQAEEGELNLQNKISISEIGIVNPAFNQRYSYIELVDGNNKKFSLTHEGIEGGM